MVVHRGGCHCGRVRFEVDAESRLVVSECNCSICRMTGYQHLIVRKSAFRLLSGQEVLTTYQFNTGIARHYFCKVCGIKSYYVPRSHPDGISVNLRCVDPGTIEAIDVEPFDGLHWEENVHLLRPLDD